MIHSYPSIFALGHKAVENIFSSDVTVEEKIDGSQFSFRRMDGGELGCRSKGQQIVADAPQKMFERAVNTAKSLMPVVRKDWIYRGECLDKPKHNTLLYDRVPRGNVIIYDIDTGLESYLSYQEKEEECRRIGLECVPLLYEGKISDWETLKIFLDQESCLGGTKIEGFVIKNYSLFTQDKKAMMAKYVSEKFKEKHSTEWKNKNPKSGDILVRLAETYKTEARWDKSIQHLAESGGLENSPRDIGNLIKEIKQDVEKECEDEIRDMLWKWAWPHVNRGITKGFPEYYKERLAKSSFKDD